MCGINGILGLKGDLINPKEIKIMNDSMKHRGPDGEGIYTKDNIGLGHRRLAIIDLSSAGKQPMLNDDESIIITFNGEIYNYKELRLRLEREGVKFKSNSDTEVVLRLYEEKGLGLLNDLRGMFSFAIWDNNKKELFIARDRFGQKPLLYGVFNDKFYFASELRAIMKASKCPKKINLDALHLYLTYNFCHIPDPYSIIQGIHKLPLSHYMTINEKEIKLTKYYSVDYEKSNKTEEEYVKEYKSLVQECVSLCEVSDVPISAFLSGGVDSSTIVALTHKKLETFSIGFSASDPELIRARKVSELFRVKNHETTFKKEYLTKNKEVIKSIGEPFSLLPATCSYVLCEDIKGKFKVALAGNGADEMFYGYDGSNGLLLLSRIEKFTPRFMAKLALLLIPEKYTSIRDALIILSAKKENQKGDLYRHYGKILRETLYTKKMNEAIKSFDEGRLIDGVTNECNSRYLIERFYYTGLFLENMHSTTIIGDATGMAHSLEIRSPFLDNKMFEYAASLPLKYKVKSFLNPVNNKYIMKKGMEDLLPQSILYGKKMGFGYNIKIGELIKNEWKSEIENALLVDLPRIGLFDEEYLIRIFTEHTSGVKDNSKLILALYNFNEWEKEMQKW